MLDFFAVITKGGLVLWYFQDAAQRLNSSIVAINALIKNVVLQERSGTMGMYDHGNLALKMSLDNEFELLYVVVYQKILKLSYVDKFLSDIQRKFRDSFGSQLQQQEYFKSYEFGAEYSTVLRAVEQESKLMRSLPIRPRTFQESEKSRKTIDSMVERTGRIFSTNIAVDTSSKKKKKGKAAKKAGRRECNNNINEGKAAQQQQQQHQQVIATNDEGGKDSGSESREGSVEGGSGEGSDGGTGSGDDGSNANGDAKGAPMTNGEVADIPAKEHEMDSATILRNRQMLFQGKFVNKKKKGSANPAKTVKKGKEARVWELDNRDATNLDYSRPADRSATSSNGLNIAMPDYLPDSRQIGTLAGGLRNMDLPAETASKKSGGLFSLFHSLVSGKSLETEDIKPVLELLRDNLIGKNVAAEIATKLCTSVEAKLIGKHVGSFEGVTSVVRTTLTESLMQLLTPKRRLDILRDVKEAQANRRPYTVAFCGVNGVGKSTNLAKVSFWLIENNFRVLIAACDTFRAGAVEQLRTHTHHLNALHPPENHGGRTMVELYEQGYGKDAADIARMAIDYGRKNCFDVVLVDTAGRMQDNEPLMRALAKLILVNEPDLTLFVGEALVGNEAVDQLVKFNRALANHSSACNKKTQMIDGILLTKFDTIDDKVGAAISMTYITGQPIVFVGTGQTYADLRNLDAKAIVHLLML